MQALDSLIVFALVATGSPGGATALATTSGARFGYVGSVPLILGIALALSTLVALSATGLASALLSVPFLALAIKGAGTAYLLWLAARIAMSGPPPSADITDEKPMTCASGALLLAVNPKAWAMGLGVASSYADPRTNPLVLGGILAAVFAASAFLSLSLWALAGRLLTRALKRDAHWTLFNAAMAVLLAVTVVQLWL